MILRQFNSRPPRPLSRRARTAPFRSRASEGALSTGGASSPPVQEGSKRMAAARSGNSKEPASPVARRVCLPGVPGPILFNRLADARRRAEAEKKAAEGDAEAKRQQEKRRISQPPPSVRALIPASPPRGAGTFRALQTDLNQVSASLPPFKALSPLPQTGSIAGETSRSSASALAARIAAKAIADEKRDEAARARARLSELAKAEVLAMLYESSSFSEHEPSPVPRAKRRRG